MSLIMVTHQYVRKPGSDIHVDSKIPPGHCKKPTPITRAFEVDNLSDGLVEDITLAYLAHGAGFWSAPILIAKKLRKGGHKSFDFRRKKIRITQVKLTFKAFGDAYADDFTANTGYFLGCHGLLVSPDLSSIWSVQWSLGQQSKVSRA